MLEEDIQDAGQIIKNILNQPLSLPDSKEDITLLQAAILFKDEPPESSALSKVLRSFLDYPEAADYLVKELDILTDELSS